MFVGCISAAFSCVAALTRSEFCPWNSCLAASFRTAVFVLSSMAINQQHKTCIQLLTTCTTGIKTSPRENISQQERT